MADLETTSGLTAATPSRRIRRYVAPAALAAAAVVLVAAPDWGLVSLHRQGAAQGVLAVVIGLGLMLRVPGNFFLGRSPSVGVGFVALTFGFYFCVLAILFSLNRAVNRRAGRRVAAQDGGAPHIVASSTATPRRVSRRGLLLGTKRVVIGGAVAGGAYPLFVEPHRIVITRRSFPVPGLPAALDGLRVVQLADIHHGPWASIGRVRRIVELTNGLAPDLVVLNGDYIQHHADYAAPVAAEMARLRPTVGAVGVLGNHDWRHAGAQCARELTRAGVRMVDNDRVFVSSKRKLVAAASEGLCVAGVGDLWTDEQLYGRALGGVPDAVPRLLLSHNPDVAEEPAFVSSRYRVDLMLSGHTHGGQVRLPLVGAPVTMSRFGQKYARGLVQGPVCPVYVSRGLGMAMLPVRLGSTPEIAVIDLRTA